MRLEQGDEAPSFDVEDVFGQPISLADFRGKRVLLSFHRFAACPLCNLRIDELVQHYPIFEAQGLVVIAFFQSQAERVKRHITRHHPPFYMLADHEKEIYARYGIENRTLRALGGYVPWNPRMLRAAGKGYLPSGNQVDGDINLLPADFLINPDQTIHTAYYGRSAADHLPIRAIGKFLESTPAEAAAQPG